MMIEMRPEELNRALLSMGLTEGEVREIGSEFSKNNFVIEDEMLLDKLLEFGKDMYTIIRLFEKLGIGKGNAVRMMEIRQKQKLGSLVNIYSLEVED
ncbi:MAG: hypothetical protein ABIH29_02995 [Candidatus Micrarchaeota archaeon]